MRRLAALVFATLAVGCGPRAFIDVEVRSVLNVPSHADGLVATLLESDQQTQRLEHTFTLHEGQSFPISFVLEPSGDTPHDVALRVVATKGTEPVAVGAIAFSWDDGQVNDVSVQLTP